MMTTVAGGGWMVVDPWVKKTHHHMRARSERGRANLRATSSSVCSELPSISDSDPGFSCWGSEDFLTRLLAPSLGVSWQV